MRNDEAELYRDVIEALGKRAKKSVVLNMLNRARARLEDSALRKMIDEIEHALTYTSTEPSSIPARSMGACKEIAARLDAHCNRMLGRS